MNHLGKDQTGTNAYAYNIGQYNCVEAPLIYKNRVAVVNTDASLGYEDKHKIAQSKLDKLVLIQSPNGKIDVRIMTINAAFNYLTNKNFDISNNHSNYFDQNFSGTLQVRKWSETVISTKVITNGAVTKNLKKRTFSNANGRTGSAECPNDEAGCQNGGEFVPYWVHICGNGDVYGEGGNSSRIVPCSHTNLTYICDYFVCNPAGNGGGNENIDCANQNLLPLEACMCAYYDLSYCDGGSGGGSEGENNTIANEPCSRLVPLTQDSNFRNYSVIYSQYVTENQERGFIKYDTMPFSHHIGPVNAGQVNFGGIYGKFSNMTHTHGVVENEFVYKSFSAQDFKTLYAYYDHPKTSTSTFSFSVITNTGNWALTISDKSMLDAFLAPYFNGGTEKGVLDLQDLFNAYGLDSETDTNDQISKRLVKFLAENNTGLAASRANADFTSYEKLTIENNQLKTTPCN